MAEHDLDWMLAQLSQDFDRLLDRNQQQRALDALWALPSLDPDWLPEEPDRA